MPAVPGPCAVQDPAELRRVLDVLRTDRLAAVVRGPALGPGDDLAHGTVERAVEVGGDVALLDRGLGARLRDDHAVARRSLLVLLGSHGMTLGEGVLTGSM